MPEPLSPEDTIRFATYLEEVAQDKQATNDQLTSSFPKDPEVRDYVALDKHEVAACILVAKMLRATFVEETP